MANFCKILQIFGGLVLGCTSYGARPQARAVNLSLTINLAWKIFGNFSKIFKNFQKIFTKNFQKFLEISATLATSSRTVSKNFRRGPVQKLGLRVDLGKSCTLRILVQNLASIQPRTSPGKIASFRQIFGNFGEAVDFFGDRFENFATRGGAKAGVAGRSRQELHVAYFGAKFGLHPAENEPRQDCKFSANFRKFRRSCRLLRRPFRKFRDAGRCKS